MPARWIDGTANQQAGLNVFGVLDTVVFGSVGFFAEPESYNPRVNELYSVRVIVGVGNPPRGAVAHTLRLRLPPGTTIDTSPGSIECSFKPERTSQFSDVTNDPAAVCLRNPPRTLNGSYNLYDLGTRDLPKNSLFVFKMNVQSATTLHQLPFVGIIESEYGSGGQGLYFTVPVSVFPLPKVVGDVLVEPRPRFLPVGRPTQFIILTRDKDTQALIPGTVRFDNFTPDGSPETFEVPTNVATTRTFYEKYDSPIADVTLPSARVRVPGYNSNEWRFVPLFSPI